MERELWRSGREVGTLTRGCGGLWESGSEPDPDGRKEEGQEDLPWARGDTAGKAQERWAGAGAGQAVAGSVWEESLCRYFCIVQIPYVCDERHSFPNAF